MEKVEDFLAKYTFLVIIILSVPAVWALLIPGFYGASDDLHVAWLFEMDKLIKMGQIPPRFVPDLSYQFGYPLFNFVFPLPFYLAEIFHLLGFNLVDSIKLLFLLTVPLSAFLMYQFLRQLTGVLISLAGAILYIYTPYRATDLYVRGAIGEIVSFVFLPLICWAVVKLYQSNNQQFELRWVGIGSLALAGLILTHNITAYMFVPLAILLFVLFAFVIKNQIKAIFNLVLMLLLSSLISLYFWWPAVVDSSLMKYDTVFNFADHFPYFKQLVIPYWGYGASVPGPGDGMSFFIGIINWLAFLTLIPMLIIFRSKFTSLQKVVLFWGVGVFLFSLIMMNYRSVPIWNAIPELPYFQFPWRFLILTTFVTPLFLILLEKLKYSKQISLGLICLIIIINAFQFRPQDFLGRTDSYFLNKYIPNPIASSEYRQTQEEYLRLPKETLIRPNDIYPTVYADQKFSSEIKRITELNSQVTIKSTGGVSLNYNKYNFPGWQVRIDQSRVAATTGQPFGQLQVQIPPGDHQVSFSFGETNQKLILDLISLITLMVVVWLVVWSPKFRKIK